MTAALATTPPTLATAGDTWTWTDTHSDYPATDSWVLAYRIAGPDVLAWDASWATVSGNTTTILIPAASTLRLRAGRYAVYAEYTLSGVRHTEAYDPLVVLANPATLTAGATRAWEETALEKVECFLAGNLADGVQYYQIGNRQVGSIPIKELFAIRDRLKAEVAILRSATSTGFGRAVKRRFVETSA